MRVLVLVDGFHTDELLKSLGRFLRLEEAELLLLYVRGTGPRAGLNLVRHGPGGHRLPEPRERELVEAELAGGSGALAEAEQLALSLGVGVETMQVSGEPGRVVCDVAARTHVDLIAIMAGGRDRPPIGPRSLGPAARFVTDHAPCPVLLLRGDP